MKKIVSDLNLVGNVIAYDTETTGLNPWGTYKEKGYFPDRPFAFSLTDSVGNSEYFRWEVDPYTRRVIPNKEEKSLLAYIFSNQNLVKVGHNLMFDIRMSRKSNIKFDWTLIHDTQIMAHILTGGSLFNYGLKPLAKKFLDYPDSDQQDLIDSVNKARRLAKKKGWFIATAETHSKTSPNKADYWLGDPKLCKKYCVGDTERTMLLYLLFIKELKQDANLYEVYKREMRLSKVVYHMEHKGVRVFPESLDELEVFYSNYADKWLKTAEKNGGKGMNFNSSPQLVQKFCIERKYKTRNITTSGNPSIDADELARLAKKDKLAKAILEYKAANSMLSKFINNYRRFMVSEDNIKILHPNYHQTGAITGRFSCSDPNLMQVAKENSIKKRADIGLKPRECLGPRPGCVWYMPDFSQMEVWVFAFQAQYKFMMDLLLNGEDFHTNVAEQVWKYEEDFEDKFSTYRSKGKTMMFLKIYGGGPSAVADQLDCSKYEAQKFINQYDSRLPGVNDFIHKVSNIASRDGYIYNPFGRKYCINPRQAYKAVNYLVQGSCADLMKNAMIRLFMYLKSSYPMCSILLTLHDELVIEVPIKSHSTKLMRGIVTRMQKDSNIVGIPVPMPVTMKLSKTKWSEKETIEL